MDGHSDLNAGFQAAAAIGIAAAIGPIVARRLRVPLPVLLLAAGLVLGVDGLDVVRTQEIGAWAPLAVALAVALIVFEGGTGINARALQKLAPVVRNLVVGGLIITPLVGMFAAHFILDFPWRVAALFGALVAVTGPSVINPLLRSIRVNQQIRATLVAEGVIIDPFGALLTFFLLQIAIADTFEAVGPATWVATRVLLGVVCGLAGSLLFFGVTRFVKRLQSREVALLAIGLAVAVFGVAESIRSESGLTAIVIMGIAVGTLRVPHREELEHFQESVVGFLVATVYVMLAASVQIDSIADLWPHGFLVVAVLVFVGRPLLVFLSSIGSPLNFREKLFLSGVAPRGVVAASLASVVAVEASGRLGADEEQFIALVFVVILSTIAVQSAYASPLARILKVYPLTTVVAGYGETGRRLARRLRDLGETITVIENDSERVVVAREEGFDVVIGDVASGDVLKRAGADEARALFLVTGDDGLNLLGAMAARSIGCDRVYAAVRDSGNIPSFEAANVRTVSMQDALADELAHLMADSPLTDVLVGPGDDVAVLQFRVTNPAARGRLQNIPGLKGALVVLIRRGSETVIPTGTTEIRFGDVVTVVSPQGAVDRVRDALQLSEAMTGVR